MNRGGTQWFRIGGVQRGGKGQWGAGVTLTAGRGTCAVVVDNALPPGSVEGIRLGGGEESAGNTPRMGGLLFVLRGKDYSEWEPLSKSCRGAQVPGETADVPRWGNRGGGVRWRVKQWGMWGRAAWCSAGGVRLVARRVGKQRLRSKNRQKEVHPRGTGWVIAWEKDGIRGRAGEEKVRHPGGSAKKNGCLGAHRGRRKGNGVRVSPPSKTSERVLARST